MAPTAIMNEGNVAVLPDNKQQHPMNMMRDDHFMLNRHLHAPPRRVARADGLYLELSNGQRILDASGGPAVSAVGHGNERVKKAIMAQQDEISYCHSMFFSCTSGEELAKLLVDSTHGEMARAFIVSSGSEAMEAALKLARQYYQESSPPQPARYKFIARRESYHGTTIGALSAGNHVARRAQFEPMLTKNISHVSPCYAYRNLKEGESTDSYVKRLAQELEDEFQRVGPESVCAFIAEPVSGAALGCVPAVPGYFQAMKEVCDRHGALLILDEVMSGMGRSGTMHVWEQESVVPDIQTIGKGLGGGYAPVAGILINHRIIDALYGGTGAFSHGHTYQGHPIACAAAAEVQRIIRDDNLLENVVAMGKALENGLRARLGDHPNVGDIRGKGLFWGIEFVKDKATREPFDPKVGVAMRVHDKGIKPTYGISVYPGTGTVDGRRGDHVIISPAYNITKEEVDRIVELTGKLVEDAFSELKA